MTVRRPALERQIASLLDASPRRIPVVVGGCGTGRTALLHDLQRYGDRAAVQYLNVEPSATTPERFLRAITEGSPLIWDDAAAKDGTARDAFDTTLAFLTHATTAAGEPATFLIDEVLELRTFESFPGLRDILARLLQALAASPNRFVLTTRFAARARRALSRLTGFEVVEMPPLTVDEVRETVSTPTARPARGGDPQLLGEAVPIVHALTGGRVAYVEMLLAAMRGTDGPGSADPISALTALLAHDSPLAAKCNFCYELRLHRARGYGALKGILQILALEEPLTLTHIAQRLKRTPGSTKDYLSWLEDVDLVTSRQKRYTFSDPLLRLWVRLRSRPARPSEEEVAREVHLYALSRLPHAEPAAPVAAARKLGRAV